MELDVTHVANAVWEALSSESSADAIAEGIEAIDPAVPLAFHVDHDNPVAHLTIGNRIFTITIALSDETPLYGDDGTPFARVEYLT